MAINFPNTPSNGDQHTASGITWTYDGTTWKADGVTSSYTLPTASATVLGGIKVGSGLTINAGVLATTGGSQTLDQVLANGNTTTRDIDTTGKIKFSNNYATLGDLPSASTYHGMFAHVHAEGHGYFAHAGAWTQLIDTSSSIGELGDVDLSSAPTDGQVLKWDNASSKWKAASDATGSSYTNSDVDTHLNTSTATSGQILSWTGTDYDWVADQTGGGGSSLTIQDEGSGLSTAATTLNFVGAGVVASGTGATKTITIAGSGTGLGTRSTVSATTASLANNAAGNLSITAHKSYALLSIKPSVAAWVTLYTDTAARTADANRVQGADPAPDAGVIAEVITTTAATEVKMSPGVIGWNNDATPSTTVYAKVVNKSGSTGTIDVELKVLQLEA